MIINTLFERSIAPGVCSACKSVRDVWPPLVDPLTTTTLRVKLQLFEGISHVPAALSVRSSAAVFGLSFSQTEPEHSPMVEPNRTRW
eukprot:700302-Rhodomonas_salina.4